MDDIGVDKDSVIERGEDYDTLVDEQAFIDNHDFFQETTLGFARSSLDLKPQSEAGQVS